MKKRILKKVVAMSIAATIGITLMACGNKKDADVVDTIKSNKKLVVGLSADFAPYEFHAMIDGKDTISGFDVELAKEIAKDLGVELEFKEMEFNSLIAALQAKQINMIISGMNPNDERKKQIDFSDIYYEAQHGVLVNSSDVDKYKKVEDLAGKIIGAQLGSTQQTIAEEQANAAKLQLLPDVNNLILELKTGKVNAIITEEPVAKMAIKNNPEIALSEIKFPAEGGGNAIGMAKGSPKLVEAVNSTIKRLKESGDLEKFIIEANDLAALNASK